MHDYDKVLSTIEAAVGRTPDAMNPTNGLGCFYTGEDGKSHCIAGQVLVDLGYTVPAYGEDNNQDAINDLLERLDIRHDFDLDARVLMNHAQEIFDHESMRHKPWAEALKRLREYEEVM
jgi:hypothetical protein